ncbi:putative uncharacterized protein DDB_G0271606 [Papaver somniferum]|uniref:putative uncharacterized protein DDB_G0271606 n=1 Tax=Papaver somniferum TaxID=3469 RepID=UPI000E704503|nr:putative uncharacterized protein DDB_G0271606 [Papaver somniferum]
MDQSNQSFHGDGDDVVLDDDYVLINPGSSCDATTIDETPEITQADSADKLSQKPIGLSAETIGGIPSTEPSSSSDSMQQQHQAPSDPNLNANNPSVSTTPLADVSILDRFVQIEKAAILYSLYKNYTDKLAAEFLSLMTQEGSQPQQKQTVFQQQQQQLQRHHLLMQQKISPSQVSNITDVINLQLRNGSITQAQADAMEAKLKMLQNQINTLGGAQSGTTGMAATGLMLEGDQSGITGMEATGKMLDGVKFGIRDKTGTGKMLEGDQSGVTGLRETGKTIVGAQSGVTGLTATGKMLGGAQSGGTGMIETCQMLGNNKSCYLNQRQQPQKMILEQRIQQLKQQQQQQLKQQEQQMKQQRQLLYLRSQQLRQQQEQTGFPLQAVVSSPLVGSPTANQSRLLQHMSSQLQQFGQQKIIQQTDKSTQLSLGSTPQVNDVAANTMFTPSFP